MKYTAISKIDPELKVELTDKREFNYGFFARLTRDCNLCSTKCRKGKCTFEGVSKGTRKSAQICREAKYSMEVVELIKEA